MHHNIPTMNDRYVIIYYIIIKILLLIFYNVIHPSNLLSNIEMSTYLYIIIYYKTILD